jgi:endo-1,4-beta-xylanase
MGIALTIQRLVVNAVLILLIAGAAAVARDDRSPAGGAPTTLRDAAGNRLLVGTAIQAAHVQDPQHAKLIGGQFHCVTPGNDMKPDALQNVKGTFTFDAADRIVAFAGANDMQVIGHTLCWHNQSPKWLFEDESGQPLPRDVALTNLESHITTVVRHFKGKVKGWDVVNEAIADGGDSHLRDTPARRAIGDDYVIKVFQFARQADPQVELYYNDYNIERDYKRDRALRLLSELKSAGVRVDGVGIQGHWLLDSPDIAEIEHGIKAFVDAGYNVMITELDVDPLPRRKGGAGADLTATEREGLDPYQNGLPDDVQRKLADRYAQLFALFLKYPQVTRVTLWGTTDDNTWLNSWPVKGRTNHPMLWDRQFRAKPARAAVLRVLRLAAPDHDRTHGDR